MIPELPRRLVSPKNQHPSAKEYDRFEDIAAFLKKAAPRERTRNPHHPLHRTGASPP
jgi:hypothetical protein